MKIRFEIDIRGMLDEDCENDWAYYEDERIEEFLKDLAWCEFGPYMVNLNQDDLKEFIKAVRELEKE